MKQVRGVPMSPSHADGATTVSLNAAKQECACQSISARQRLVAPHGELRGLPQ